jgi:formyltetrahydrofolate-dependent phosphoribosylglycinamide formyltransferase
MTSRRRTAVLISGRGSNMQALLRAALAPSYPAEIRLVVSNRPEAAGLRAAEGVATRVIDHRPFGSDREAHEAVVARVLSEAGIEIVCLAGYMRRLTHLLVSRYAGRMLNTHPSLLPAFPGLNTHARALERGVLIHGCTVHFVTDMVDQGPILAQAAVPVLAGDTADTLAARVLAQEHRIYPLALAMVAGNRMGEPPNAAEALCNPLPGGPPVS